MNLKSFRYELWGHFEENPQIKLIEKLEDIGTAISLSWKTNSTEKIKVDPKKYGISEAQIKKIESIMKGFDFKYVSQLADFPSYPLRCHKSVAMEIFGKKQEKLEGVCWDYGNVLRSKLEKNDFETYAVWFFTRGIHNIHDGTIVKDDNDWILISSALEGTLPHILEYDEMKNADYL